MIKSFETIAAMRAAVAKWKSGGERVGLVPTMGALHGGHLSLIDRLPADRIIVSIFVNPTQFAEGEDFRIYPRDLKSDLAALGGKKIDAVFLPPKTEIYPPDFATAINMRGPALGLEAEARPHFFGGVALVVCKLLLQSQCDVAIFGEKDYQQLLVIRQLVRDLNIPTDIVGAPIMREADGLAMSSRNAYLTKAQRVIAARLNQILRRLADSPSPHEQAEAEATATLLQAGFDAVDYAVLRDADTLAPITESTRTRRALIAARLGKLRLIDNMPAK